MSSLMKTKLTLEEMETAITQAADDRSKWNVYSDDPLMVKRLQSQGLIGTKVANSTGYEFTLPARWLSIRKPREYSAEQREKMADNMRKAREAGRNGTQTDR